ncbi:MAG: alpha/beta fold hydrolase [Lapillicoccus sp.]
MAAAAAAAALTVVALAACSSGPDDGGPTGAGPALASAGPGGTTGAAIATGAATATGASWTGLATCPGEPQAYRCGVLRVPLDRAAPGAGTVDLSVLVGGSIGATRTMLFLTGGPGQGGVAAAERVIQRFAQVGAQLRIVLLDQRGTGAGALRCPALQQQMRSSDLAVPTEDAVTSCATTIGPDRAHYATSDTVADLEDLRAALGAEKWSLDGVSYGSYVAQRYAAAHPDRVDRLVLDSVVPVTGFDPLLTDVYPEVARVLRAVCAQSRCGGDPADALSTTVRRWPDLSPVLLDLVTGMSVADPTFSGLVPALLQAAAGQDQLIRTFAAGWRTADKTEASDLSQGLHASTLCLDLEFPWGGADADPGGRMTTVDARVAALPADRLFPFEATAAGGNGEVVTCRVWPRTPDAWSATDAQATVAALARSGPRTLILAGDRDLSTPLVWAKATAAAMPGSRLVVVPGAGHSVQSRGGAVGGQEAAAFLLSP